jgi:osomolarity two-component system sensor histidine kinase NIK1
MSVVCGRQLSSLIDDILDISKIDENKMKLENEPFQMGSTIQEAIQVTVFPALNKKIEMICDMDLSIFYL